MSNGLRVQTWYSLASVTGLSLVSLGSPGFRPEMDEQIFTGGTTAVAQLLGEEVGAMSDDFMGGGATSRFGRFMITKEDLQFFALFLLVSAKDPLPDSLVEFSREFILAFANELLETQEKRLTSGFEQIEHHEVQEEFKKALKMAKKKIRVSSDDDFLRNEVESFLKDAVIDFRGFSSLQSLADDDRPVRDMLTDLRKEHSQFIEKLAEDTYLHTLARNPLPLMLCSKLDAAKNIIAGKITEYLPMVTQTLDFQNVFAKLVAEVNETDIPLITQSIDIASTSFSRETLHSKVSAKLVERLRENHPLALIASPEMSFGTTSVEKATESLVDGILERYDLGNTLRTLAKDLAGGGLCGLEIGEFVRYFASRFPREISPIGWSFLKYVFDSLAESRKEVKDLLKEKELPESHMKILKQELKGRKTQSLQAVTIALEEGTGDELSTFFDAISASVAKGVAQFFDAVVGTYQKPGRLFHNYAYRLEEFCANADALYAAFRSIQVLAARKRDSHYLSDTIPAPEYLIESKKGKGNSEEILSDPKLISQLWKSEKVVSQAMQTNLLSYFDSQLSKFQEYHQNAFESLVLLFQDIDKAYEDLEKEKKPRLENLIRKCEDITIERIEDHTFVEQWYIGSDYLKDAKLEARESLEKAKEYLNRISRGKSVSKKAEKERNRASKSLERLKKNKSDIDDRIMKDKAEFEKKALREVDKSKKDIKKLQRDLSFKMIKLSNLKDGSSYPNPRDFLAAVQEQMGSVGDEDLYLSELGSPAWLYAWASIFQRPPESALNKAFRDALTGSKKKVPLVRELVKEISDSDEYELAEILRDKLRVRARRLLTRMIAPLREARPWFLAQDPTVFRVTANGEKDDYLVKIAEFPENYITPNVKEWFRQWESAEYVIQDGMAQVCLSLNMEGRVSKKSQLSEALARTGIAALKREYKPYLDILETSCGLLSSSRKEAFHNFILELEKQIDSAVE
ncbi:MAG: hypothetical protein ACFFGZ_12790 [Candidatus Thorarchaeota archaeon]